MCILVRRERERIVHLTTQDNIDQEKTTVRMKCKQQLTVALTPQGELKSNFFFFFWYVFPKRDNYAHPYIDCKKEFNKWICCDQLQRDKV
jgi:hypothetical protein